jgi:membrane-associated phospholipid phosphatase
MSTNEGWLTHWARLAGEHALGVFLALLALVLVGVVVFWWVAKYYAAARLLRMHPSLLLIAAPMGAGFLAIGACAWIFAELAKELGAEGRSLGLADQALTDALSMNVPAAAMQVFAALTHLGDTLTLTLLCSAVAIALVAIGRRGLAFGWVAAIAGNGVLNTVLKQIFKRVRPIHDGGFVSEHGFSFPSGHSSGSLVAYCMLAYLAQRLLPPSWHLPAMLVAVALAFTVGASRVFLRVHFASDVIAGFASGAAWLAMCIGSIEAACWYRGVRLKTGSNNR